MRTRLSTLGFAALFGLAAFATMPAHGQTATVFFAPNNSAVKVNDYSTANQLSVTMEGPAQKNTASTRVNDASGSSAAAAAKLDRPKAVERKKKASR